MSRSPACLVFCLTEGPGGVSAPGPRDEHHSGLVCSSATLSISTEPANYLKRKGHTCCPPQNPFLSVIKKKAAALQPVFIEAEIEQGSVFLFFFLLFLSPRGSGPRLAIG